MQKRLIVCVRCTDGASPKAAAREACAPPPRPAAADREGRHGGASRAGRPSRCGRRRTAGGCARGRLRCTARLQPHPGRAGARHQPLDAASPSALRRDDRDALGRHVDPHRRTRASRRRATAGGARSSATCEAWTKAESSADCRRAHPHRTRRRAEPSADRRRPQREWNADRARRKQVVAVDGTKHPPTPKSKLYVTVMTGCLVSQWITSQPPARLTSARAPLRPGYSPRPPARRSSTSTRFPGC